MTADQAAPLTAVILAAGQGTRMKSPLPKVLHPLCGRPMLHYVVDAAFQAGAADVVVVVGHGRDEVSAQLASAFGDRVRTAVQETQRGTGDAVRCALPQLRPEADAVLLLCGDTPLLEAEELKALWNALSASSGPLAMLTMTLPDPTGYGRILRGADGQVLGIREHKDASPEERAITEVNPGVYVARTAFLREALTRLTTDNAQGELYLTDIVAQAATAGGTSALSTRDPGSLAGINDRAQLAAAEDVLHHRIADAWRRKGATIRTSARIDASVALDPDAIIEHGVVLRGATRIGAGAHIDVGSVLTDVVVAAGAVLKPYTVAQRSSIGEKAQIGPFSHLRPDSEIHDEAHIGNFVETKKTVVRRGAKANHLAYLGDGDIGEGANVGAGTIFCNYDGFRKHKTEIGPGAFIGSDSQLVAPIRIGAGAYVGTGTTVTRDVPDDALAIGRARQENKEGYASRLKGRLKIGK
ncbi:bifunctional UDP-N-acetylglucosamine diphosphorylase/glucosamine-1-phosphate N-acetyltransferase GlmU [Chondromyces crocatus]|uniref:Bifunctional protein GlmU n=1 Tax=Chondromyces crocatus TaxID=52 RepID=A0A0K1EEY7_CHOCO|nr:bifunctional UDP-N-acetylglucosamine diphosphorylase/glucosamine-1-phosphate N-acetyltransferase GlmU [Chondromyces crocatus]AKT39257.1 bifunctional N-acetylglucosamine-1-phosphate uridyltransferase/glucosamine-1-phosphate acetyltransferase [Chondromyces crocatus]